MTEALKAGLQKLLAQHPELKNTTVAFPASGGSFAVKDEGGIAAGHAAADKPLCEQTEPEPDVIKGQSYKIELRKSPVHGYGVFAKEAIEQGELIEEYKMLRLGWRQHYMNDSVLNDYVWGNKMCTCKECETHGHVQYLALGFGSLYNHADQPNTIMSRGFKTGVRTIKAARQIEKDEEIFITYGKKYFLIRDFLKTVEENKALEKHLEAKREQH